MPEREAPERLRFIVNGRPRAQQKDWQADDVSVDGQSPSAHRRRNISASRTRATRCCRRTCLPTSPARTSQTLDCLPDWKISLRAESCHPQNTLR